VTVGQFATALQILNNPKRLSVHTGSEGWVGVVVQVSELVSTATLLLDVSVGVDTGHLVAIDVAAITAVEKTGK
jgi:hypothetical protein